MQTYERCGNTASFGCVLIICVDNGCRVGVRQSHLPCPADRVCFTMMLVCYFYPDTFEDGCVRSVSTSSDPSFERPEIATAY